MNYNEEGYKKFIDKRKDLIYTTRPKDEPIEETKKLLIKDIKGLLFVMYIEEEYYIKKRYEEGNLWMEHGDEIKMFFDDKKAELGWKKFEEWRENKEEELIQDFLDKAGHLI